MPGILITGTDTGVGKTLVTCGLAACCAASGRSVGVMKPVETGCPSRGGQLYPEDAAGLAFFSGWSGTLEEICPYRFAPPLAPSVAARQAGVAIEPASIVTRFRQLSRQHDTVLVEGAGGLLVPLVGRYTFADLARDLEVPLLVVVGSKLGALNHSLLTLHHAAAQALPVQGYLINHPAETEDAATRSNGPALAELTDVPCLGRIPHLHLSEDRGKARERLLAVFAEHVKLERVLDWKP